MIPEMAPEHKNGVPDAWADTETDGAYDPFTRWEELTPEQQLHEILTTFDVKGWVKEPALSVLASFRQLPVQWATVVLAWRERAPFTKLSLLEDAVDAWRGELGLGEPEHAATSSRKRTKQTHTPAVEAPEPWMDDLTRNRSTGEARETFHNLALSLESLSPWRDESWFDVVRHRCMVGKEPLDERMIWQAARAIEQQVGIGIRQLGLVGMALRSHCHNSPHDLLQEWLVALPPWDGIVRLTEWLADHADVPKTDYTMEVARLLPVSMVARALVPGIQCRSVVILEGPQNIGKSKVLKTLAGDEWYREVAGTLEGKEAHILMKGTWLVELSEMDVLSRTEESRVKNFVTMCNDEYVPKYANDPVKLARRTILAGTINPEGDGSYLRDQTGATRYFPVKVGAIAIDDVAAIREQLFAEALAWFQSHPDTWWQMSPTAEAELALIREMRRKEGVFEGPRLHEWLAKVQTGTTEVTSPFHTEDALRFCFNIPPERWTTAMKDQAGKAISRAGWESKPSRARGPLQRLWFPKPPVTPGKGVTEA